MALTAPLFPSLTATSLMNSAGNGSLLLIVPTPWLSASVALTGLLRFTKNDSAGSKMVSPVTLTVMVWVTVPGAKLNVPLVAK